MATYDETLAITTELLQRRIEGGRAVRPQDAIQNDLGLDSLGVMEFVADLEARFDLLVPNDVIDRVVTVEDVVRALVDLQTKKKIAG